MLSSHGLRHSPGMDPACFKPHPASQVHSEREEVPALLNFHQLQCCCASLACRAAGPVAARRSAPCASVLLSCSTQKGPAAVASSSSLMMEALQVAAFCRSRGHALVLARAVAASGTDTDGVRLSAQRRRRLHLPALTSRRWGHPRRLRSELRGRRGECAAAEGVRGCRGSARLPRELYASGAFCSAAASSSLSIR